MIATARRLHHSRIRAVVLLSLLVSFWSAFAAPTPSSDLATLRKQFDAAQEADDDAATAEIGRRIVALAPNDNATWEAIAQIRYDADDVDGCEEILNAWAHAVKSLPPVYESFRGGVAYKRHDYAAAEKHFLAAVAKQQTGEVAADVFENLGVASVDQAHWIDAEKYFGKAVTAKDSASRRVSHATSLLRLHRWDAAYAEMAKANKIDSEDSEVKEWLPQFERLQKFLPEIKVLDRRIAKLPNDAELLLQRARLFILAARPLLAIDDGKRAMELQPAWVRARIETAEALLDAQEIDAAAKLHVSAKLTRGEDRHVPEELLRELAEEDARCLEEPDSAEALAARSKTLRKLNQFGLALADAGAALALDEDVAAAHFEAAHSFDELGRRIEAMAEIIRATAANPKDAVAWFYRGLLEAKRGEFAAAIESQTKSIALKESLVALKEREQCARRLGKNKEADVDLARIQQLEPKPQ